ncbi:MAG: aquaporin [Chloroflexi bacterium]|nr:aquaporin [Chloroflexota bacterium]
MGNGFGVAVMSFAFWAVSGAHLNPAVSLGLWLTGRLPGRKLAPYVGAQLVGALIASSVMHGLFRNHTGDGESWLGANFSTGPVIQAFGTEIVITFFLVYAILMLAERGRGAAVFAVAVGLYVAAAVTLAGSVSGASMNPARAFGPAAIAWFWDNHWVYWVAPGLGALFAALFFAALRDRSSSEPPSA